jgi:CBS domain-containing protein
MAPLVRDVMQRHVITVDAELPLVDAHRLFVEEEIHGAPVVDETGRLLGVLSSADLLRAVEEAHDSGSTQPRYLREELEFSGPDWAYVPRDFQDRLSELVVGDAMTRGGVTVAPDAPVAEAARLMREHRIHRVPVVEAGILAGIVTTFDLVALLEKAQAAPAPARRSRRATT